MDQEILNDDVNATKARRHKENFQIDSFSNFHISPFSHFQISTSSK